MEKQQRQIGVFISYSHKDKEIVSPVYNLIQSSREDIAFMDSRSIKPGDQWETQIEQAILSCNIFYLFWCCHSSVSLEVAKECTMALLHKKTIIPLVLDNTAVPESISQFEYIDFKNLKTHTKHIESRGQYNGDEKEEVWHISEEEYYNHFVIREIMGTVLRDLRYTFPIS